VLSITDNPQCEELNDKNDSVNWNHRKSALKLAKECNESLFKLTIEGPNVMSMKMLEDKLSQMESIRIRQEQEQLFASSGNNDNNSFRCVCGKAICIYNLSSVEYDPAKDPNRVF
jgi:gamma-glutamylcysteine synthetase